MEKPQSWRKHFKSINRGFRNINGSHAAIIAMLVVVVITVIGTVIFLVVTEKAVKSSIQSGAIQNLINGAIESTDFQELKNKLKPTQEEMLQLKLALKPTKEDLLQMRMALQPTDEELTKIGQAIAAEVFVSLFLDQPTTKKSNINSCKDKLVQNNELMCTRISSVCKGLQSCLQQRNSTSCREFVGDASQICSSLL